MKITYPKSLKSILAVGVAIIAQSTSASAALIIPPVGEIVLGNGATFTPPSSLILNIAPFLTVGVPIATPTFANWAQMNDGIVGTAIGQNSQAILLDNQPNSWVIWKLDLSVNTFGYDITSFQSFAGFQQERVWQGIQIKYALVGDTILDPTLLVPKPELPRTLGGGPFVYQPVNPVSSAATKMTIEDDVFGTVFLTGVSAIQLIYSQNGFGNNQTAYREFSVVGFATVPEPSSILLSGMALFGLLLKRRRSRH